MEANVATAGGRLAISCAIPWIGERIREGADDELTPGSDAGATVRVSVEAEHSSFPTTGWTPITRDAWARDGAVVIRDVATSGFDLRVRVRAGVPTFTFRWRPPPRTRAAAAVLQSRARLLTRAVLVQYPPLWAASLSGLVPLHAGAVSAGSAGVALLTGASGAGKTSLVTNELAHGGCTVADNLTTTDGRSLWGVVEPIRRVGGRGRRAPHGRRESHLSARVPRLEPDVIVVVHRGERTSVRHSSAGQAARSLVASTYAAGELRRYWAIHAVLAMGTGLGPAHPDVSATAELVTADRPCVDVTLADPADTRLADLLADHGMLQWI
jgi:hypothetical protein